MQYLCIQEKSTNEVLGYYPLSTINYTFIKILRKNAFHMKESFLMRGKGV